MKVIKDKLIENSILNAQKLITESGFGDQANMDLCSIFRESIIKAMDEFEEDRE